MIKRIVVDHATITSASSYFSDGKTTSPKPSTNKPTVVSMMVEFAQPMMLVKNSMIKVFYSYALLKTA